MSQEVLVTQKKTLDFDDFNGQVTCSPSTNGNKITFQNNGVTNFRTRTGQKARLVFVGNSVQSGAEALLTFHIRINGALLQTPYDSFQQAMGETYNGWAILSAKVDLPQNALVEVLIDNADGSNSWIGYIRVRIEYESLN